MTQSRRFLILAAALAAFSSARAQLMLDPRDTITSFAVGGWGVSLDDQDRSIRPGDDFSGYQNGAWLKRVRGAGLDRNDSYWRDLMRLPARQVAGILRELAADHSLSPATAEGKAAAFYRSFMDSATIRRKGLTPLEPALAAIRAVKTKSELARVMGMEAGAWTPRPVAPTVQNFPLAPFTLQVNQDPRDARRSAVFIGAAGLMLPARPLYSDPGAEPIRQAYVQYIADMLRLVSWPDPDENARDILALETRIAAASWTQEQRQNFAALKNPITVADLRKFAPDFDWKAFLAGAGLPGVKEVVIDTRSAFPGLAKIFAETPPAVWRARQAFAVLDQDAPKLSDAAAALALDFRARRFNGSSASQPPDFRVMLVADGTIPDIIGALYARRYFPSDVRAATQEMARRIRVAFDARLAASPYLSDASKARARAKLAAMQLDIGAPDRVRDYRGLVLSDSDYFGNIRRAREFEWRRQIATLDDPFDRTVWPLQPHNSNYTYIPQTNVMEANAGVLVPPFFDIHADPAVNYGAIGTLMASTMAAAFNGNGRLFGPDGRPENIFTAAEVARIDSLRDSLATQLSGIEALPGQRLRGKLLVDEDFGDIIGIQVALDAYHASLGGQPAPVLDGFTGDQRFFLGRAQMWRAAFVPAFLNTLIAGGWNTPPLIRINVTAQHLDAWYDAFGVQPDQRLYLAPARRLHFLF